MGYDDGFYYGKGKIICLATKSSDNGKLITVAGNGNTFEGTMVEGKCEFSVPGKNRYTINMAGEFTKTIDVSYGECIGVYMAEGYDLVTQENLSTAVTSLENRLKSNFQAGVDSIYNAIKSKGTTPASKSLGDVSKAIGSASAVIKVTDMTADGEVDVNTILANAGRSAASISNANFIIQITGWTTPTKTNDATFNVASATEIHLSTIPDTSNPSISYDASTGKARISLGKARASYWGDYGISKHYSSWAVPKASVWLIL